ncbi:MULTISPECIES: alpha/beta hydrolase family protein [unclassified Tenacibaculum]|uniref:alpha/beta hydrolase family protein n=1 Tax=unclassified Tenacibaculum TaxID=2635139 RepID=UPI001F31E73D|nr:MULTISPECIES: prolyl oligopeptidase family serine peptidase [unclassified Tenacibaculum]MCF2876469.1 prolyl oligopeptidase family serine peptidase [Tenacibaculum sp. Cn5-1]MCF2936624.1 prolyl oligopeptidase family serine peptidase [Tenacibaculum sp. Cn5-34]MCG7511783.1 prolyl oligopeptidase family serine peptidase [Tenacibaculum sp. Cn5-46]
MKKFILHLLIIVSISCSSQESIIVKKEKIDWKNYKGLFQDAEQTQFKAQFKFLQNVKLYEITYLSDSLEIQSFATFPKKEGKYPVIIFNRGGNRDFGALSLTKEKHKLFFPPMFSKITNNDYIVIGCNYRESGKSEGKDEFGGKDVNDVLNLLKVVKEFPKADTTRIGMYGWSRGGMMTYLSLTKTSKIKTAIIGGAPTDLTIIDRADMEVNVYAPLIPNYWKNKQEELKKRSALYFANKFPKNIPLLILHGDADKRVNVSSPIKLSKELDKYNIPYRLKIYKEGNHGLTKNKKEVNREVLDWFQKHLRN